MTAPALYCPQCFFVGTAVTRCPQHPHQGLLPPAQTANDEWIGTTILPAVPGQRGRYEILALLGVGGMGATYLAWQIDVERSVAFKIMRADSMPAIWQYAIAAARNDAAIPSRLPTSQNIVVVHEAGSLEDGRRYLVLEHLRGHDLSVFGHTGVSAELAVELIIQACNGFAEIHRAGIVHRDVKLENLYLHDPSPPGRARANNWVVKIIDFGIACPMLQPQLVPAGTGDYMAPEQFFPNAELDGRADIYGLGVSLYRLLTTFFPFLPIASAGVGFSPYIAAHLTQAPRAPSRARPDLAFSAGLDEVVMRSISRSRDERFSTMDEFRIALNATREASESATSLDRPLSARVSEHSTLPHVSFAYCSGDPWSPPDLPLVQLTFNPGRVIIVDRYRFNMYVDEQMTATYPIEHREKPYSIRVTPRHGGVPFAARLHGGVVDESGVLFDLGALGKFRASTAHAGRLLAVVPSAGDRVIFVSV